jgi:hypothetical protein
LRRIRKRLSYADVMSTIAVVLALGGATAFAASSLSRNSVGTAQLKKDAVTGAKVRDGSLTGQDVNASTLGQVPAAKAAESAAAAQRAGSAARADNAARAERSDRATEADTAQRASIAEEALRLQPPENLHVVGDPGQPRFGAGWENFGTNRRASFYMDRQGIVHLQGEVKRVAGAEIRIFTLPPSYAPAPEDGQFFPVITSGNILGTIVVEPSGEVNFGVGNSGAVFLDGITWRAGK